MDVVMPQLGETVTEGTVTVWRKKEGETVAANEVLFEVSTDKVDTEVEAPASGVLRRIIVAEGETVGVGTTLAVIDDGSKPSAEPASGKEASRVMPPNESAAASRSLAGVLSPVVARLIAEHGLDAAAITGSGRDGRITRRDVLAHVEAGGGVSPKDAAPESPPAAGDVERIPLSRVQRLIAEHMVRSKSVSAHVLQAVEADFSAVAAARAVRGEAWRAAEGFALTWLPFVARALCRAIAEFPRVNASIEGDSLLVHRAVHLAIAVDIQFTELVVPVIRDAQDRSLAELARAIRDLAERARSRSLFPDEVRGGTYTIANNGGNGTLITAPIINQPQVAVLSIDAIARRPVVVEGAEGEEIAIRPIGVLAQSFDHRAFGGAYSGAFLNRLKEIIEATDWTAELG